MKLERLQKILAQSGIASRRAAERLIEDGRVRVNGRVVTELGAKADPRKDRIDVDDKRIVAEKRVYIAFHKPRGVVSTMSDPEGRPTVKDYFDRIGARVVPVGRLDFATSGVLLATNDGDFAFALLHPKQKVPKTYVLKTAGEMKEADLEHWRGGIELDDGITQPAEVTLLRHENGKTWLELTITEGRNQMIRRMGEKTGFPVMRLARTSFAGVSSEHLPPGRWRMLTRDELLALKKKYGVPRSLPSALEEPEPAERPRGKPGARRFDRGAAHGSDAHGRAPARAPQARGRGPHDRDRAEPSRGRSSQDRDRGEPRRGRAPHDRDRTQPSHGRETSREERSGRGSRGEPAHGSSASRTARWKQDEGPNEPYGLGRGGRSRTTGSGGGIGGSDGGDYRMKRTRRG